MDRLCGAFGMAEGSEDTFIDIHRIDRGMEICMQDCAYSPCKSQYIYHFIAHASNRNIL